jgi:hypothetical protein
MTAMRAAKRLAQGDAREREAFSEEASFRRLRPRLLRRYKGEYVALYRGRVIAHGANDGELAAEMYTTLGDVPFFIARVEEEPEVYEIPSPETVR